MRPSSLAVALFAATSSVFAETTKSNCTDGLYIIVARGTGEPEGTGAFSNISKSIASQVGDSIIEPLEYPATFTDPAYNVSEVDGVKEMREVILDYHKACPKAKFAVLGYSQGGQVSSDVFCGGSGDGFSTVAPLPLDLVTNYFAAIVLFGDPSHIANISYDRGTSKKDGIFARNNVTFCEKHYSNLIRSYCDTGDIYCDEGEDEDVHGSYFKKYGKSVVDFVVQQYQSMKESSATTTTTATSPSSTSSASSTSTSTKDAGNSADRLVPHLAFIVAVWIGLSTL